jgi:hypothetical protein
MSDSHKPHRLQLRVIDLLLVALFVSLSIVTIKNSVGIGVLLPGVIGVALPCRLGYGWFVTGVSVLLAYAFGFVGIFPATAYFHEVYPVPISQLNRDAWIDVEIKILSTAALVFVSIGSNLTCILASTVGGPVNTIR